MEGPEVSTLSMDTYPETTMLVCLLFVHSHLFDAQGQLHAAISCVYEHMEMYHVN